MKYITSIIIASVLLCGLWSHQSYAQDDSHSLVEHAVRLRSPGDDWPRHIHLERTIEEAQKAMGLEDPFGDEFYRQVNEYLSEEQAESWKITHLLSLVRLLGDTRAAPGLVRMIDNDSPHSAYAFQTLTEIDPNNPAINRIVDRQVRRALAGPPYLTVGAELLHAQPADLAIENAERVIAFVRAERERLGPTTTDNWDDTGALSRVGQQARIGRNFAKMYQWADIDDPMTVIEKVITNRYADGPRGRIHPDAWPRIHQAIRRRGLVDLYVQEVRRRNPDAELHEVPGRAHIAALAPHLRPDEWRQMHVNAGPD
ncbi:MAG: hypothetical protein EA376_11155 [Phycisphaeraceae bacterium]|nr:MAG: hypothetical protein EA376_11155 [Phycisphaeraceae bacterium]